MTGSPLRRARSGFVIISIVVALATLASCSSGDDPLASPATTVAPPPTAPSTAISGIALGPTSGPMLVSPFLLHDGWIAKGSAQQVESPDGLNAALDALLAGPTEVDLAAGLTTAVPENAEVRSLTIEDGVAVVDFTRPFETRDTQPQVAQVVFTLTQVEGITAVRFLIDGETNGATGVKPLTRANYARYTPPAIVETPTPGQTVASPVAVSGTASTVGATVTYRLEDPAGALLAEGSFVAGDDGVGGAPFAGTIEAAGFHGQAVLVMPAPDPSLDGTTVTRVPIAIS